MTAKRLISLHWKYAHLVDGDQSFPNVLVKEKSTCNLVELYSEEPEWMSRLRHLPFFRD